MQLVKSNTQGLDFSFNSFLDARLFRFCFVLNGRGVVWRSHTLAYTRRVWGNAYTGLVLMAFYVTLRHVMRNASKLACRLANNTLANIQANLSPFRCIPHYVTQRDVERNNCSFQYRHFPRPYVYTRGCGYARLGGEGIVSYPDPNVRKSTAYIGSGQQVDRRCFWNARCYVTIVTSKKIYVVKSSVKYVKCVAPGYWKSRTDVVLKARNPNIAGMVLLLCVVASLSIWSETSARNAF